MRCSSTPTFTAGKTLSHEERQNREDELDEAAGWMMVEDTLILSHVDVHGAGPHYDLYSGRVMCDTGYDGHARQVTKAVLDKFDQSDRDVNHPFAHPKPDGPASTLTRLDKIGTPKKSSGHYRASERQFWTLYSVTKTLLDTI